MASLPGDDQTDADFFDKLVNDDDDLVSTPAAAPVEREAAMARGLPSLSLADDEAEGSGAPKAAVAVLAPATATAPAAEATEDGSPGSGKGIHNIIKQVQWSVFGGDGGGGADPFGEFGVGGGGEEAFFGSVMGNRSLESSVVGSIGAADHSLFGGTTGNQNSAREVTDQDFLEGSLNQKADAPLEENSGDAASSTDPKYLERLYPGWKYDEVTQQWYQVDSFGVTGNATQVVNSSENAQQKQQQFDVSYLQNSAQVALETIAEEGSATVGSISSWAQDSSGSATEYPPNMLFYAEYPGWYFDTNTQQWNALELYQQAIAQGVTTTAIQDGASQGNGMGSNGFAGTDRSTEQTEDLAAHNQGAQQNSFANSYSQQSYWQPDMFGNDSQPDSLADNSLAGSFYSVDQHVNAETFSTNHQIGFNTSEPSTGHYGGNECLESSGFQSGYGSFGGQQAGYMGFEPSTGLTSYKGFEPSTSHPAGYKGFEPSTGHQAGYKGFKPSKGRQAGFEPSTGQQAGYKGFEPSTGQQAGYKGFEPSTGHHANYKGFEPSTAHHAGYKAFDPSTGHQTGYKGFETSTSHGYGNVNAVAEAQGFLPTESIYQSQTHSNASPQMPLSNSYFGGENMSFPQQQASHLQYGYSPHEQRSSAGRPPHALIAFGFGGKLIVMKETSSMTTNFNGGNQGNSSGTVSVLNLSDIVADKVDASDIASGSALSYFHALCRQPIPGPLVGGSAATKDVNKWLDEMITGYESSSSEFQRGDRKLLISLLKILCQHYGKLRSPFGSDPSQEDLDGPETAVTKLFSSSKSSVHMTEFGSIVPCMKNLPSESQLQAIAQEVQSLLVSGRRKEALQRAQEGQLWGPAIILALQLGDKFYVDTVKKMAQCHFIFGSPLRTLCLLIAGQPGDVFNVENRAGSSYGTLSAHQQPMEPTSNGMLDDWEENLAIITANRTKGDDLVITHLGDCLWREKNKVAAAHSCYLVAELNIDAYSESARLCLIGADHLKHPRTFASPEAIQRTEVYEYAKVLGNSQYILLPFQPYKLIYAYMLVEVGKVSDSLRYCQASLKALKASGRTPELEAWKQLFLSLEERIRTHQQGGYGTNLAPAKLVGKLFTSLDKSISRMMGTPSAPLPPMPQGSVNDRDSYPAPAASKVVNSQSVMAMSSLVPSTSVQSMSEMAGDSSSGRKIAHNRSVSEPDFGRTPKQGAGSDSAQSSASGLGSSRFGWFSSTLQRTMGLVSRSHRQAKLGEQNKFYYDEKLKRWVDPSAEAPAEEPPLAPPPTKPSFQNGLMDHNLNGPMSGSHTPNGFPELKSSNPAEQGLGMPPIPPSQNQFSARGRIGVRSRYVDTFNKGGAPGAMPSYNKPAAPSMQPPAGTKFFVPTAAVVSAESAESIPDQAVEAHSESAHQDQPSSSQPAETSFSSSPLPAALSSPAPSTIHRHPSMDNITPYSGSKASPGSINSSLSRTRAASWSGTYSERLPPNAGARSPEGQTMPSQFMPGNPSHNRSNSNSSVQFNGLTEDLHEVEL